MRIRSIHYSRLLYRCCLLVGLLLVACNPVVAGPPATRTGDASPAGRFSTPSPTARAAPQASAPVPPTPTASSQIEVIDAELKGISLKFWHNWPGETAGLVDKLVAAFNRDNAWGIQVQAESAATPDEMYLKVNQAIEAGEPPALAMAYPYQALGWGQKHPLVDLNLYVNDPVWGLTAQEQSDFYPVFWNQDITAGKRYGIPAQRSGQLLYYNQTWAQQLGFDAPPQTTEALREQACAAAQANRLDADPGNDQTGGIILTTNYTAMLGWLSAFGSGYLRSDGAASSSPYRFDNQQAEAAFTFLRTLADEGCAWQVENLPVEVDFAARRGLFAVGGVTEIPYQADVIQRASSADRWTVIPFPSPSGKPAISVYGSAYILFESTPQEQLAAWLLIKWLLAPQNQAELVENAAVYPLQSATLESLEAYRNLYPQWSAAVELIPQAQPEPPYASWRLVRWALSDATTQLFRYYFTAGQVPELLELLDDTAAELHATSTRAGS